jgi:Flp pilus assembly protein TadD
MLRFAPRLTAVFLCGVALAGCAAAAPPKEAVDAAKEKAAVADKSVPTDLDGGIRQAQLLRTAGKYDEAIHILSQLMLAASDDPRVVAEYGKALAQDGRAQEASEFLNRAIELSGNDWTLYSALGVSYDQLGNQASARVAYEHALALKPDDASVLNNYALSRMLASDTDGAKILMARAQAAGGANDPKIAANIALVNKLTPATTQAIAAAPPPPTPIAQNAPRPSQPQVTPAQQVPAPIPVASAALPAAQLPTSVAQNAPHPLVPPQPQQIHQPQQPNGVVMQTVPVDPLAGPVKVANRKPTPAPDAKPASKTAVALIPPVITIDPKAGSAKPASKTAVALIPPVITIDPKAGDAKSAGAKSKIADAKDTVPALRLAADARSP